jgi:hypothetical protein
MSPAHSGGHERSRPPRLPFPFPRNRNRNRNHPNKRANDALAISPTCCKNSTPMSDV